MRKTNSIKEKMKQLLFLSIPILITQISLFLLTFINLTMSGNVGPSDLAGVAIGSSLWTPVYMGLNGVILALTPVIVQLLGENNEKEIPFKVYQGMYLALFLSITVIAAGFFLLDPLLNRMDLTGEVRNVARNYLTGLSWGIFPLFLFNVFRCYLDAIGLPRFTMFVMLASLPVSFVTNYILVFGNFGFEPLGGAGAGYATALTYWVMCISAFAMIHWRGSEKSFNIFRDFTRFSSKDVANLLKIGIPIGFSIFFESSIFAIITLLMSEFSTETIAANQATINFSALLYMIPMSISLTLTIAIGFEVGAGRLEDAYQYSKLGLYISIGFAVFCTIFLVVFRNLIAAIYTNDPSVLSLIGQFLIYASVFQLADGIAVPIKGILRGYKDVNISLVISIISYWGLGLPVGYLLANYTGFGAFGYWIGLILGLSIGALLLWYRLRQVGYRQVVY